MKSDAALVRAGESLPLRFGDSDGRLRLTSMSEMISIKIGVQVCPFSLEY